MSNKQRSSAKSGKSQTGPVTHSRPANARKLAEEQAAFEARVRRNRTLRIGSIALVVLIVVAFFVVKMVGGGTAANASGAGVSPAAGTPISSVITNKLRSIPLTSLTMATTGGLGTYPQAIDDPSLTAAGKPDLLYIGAEFCPVCATERWAMYVALSKFGTFSPQPGQIHSALQDGDIPTLTFYGTTFTSRYLTFTPVETTTNQPEGNYYAALQKPTATEQQLWQSHTGESFPWLDFGGRMQLASAQFDPTILEGQTFSNIVSEIGNNSTLIGADIDAASKVLIQSICSLTGGQPSSVCSAVGHG